MKKQSTYLIHQPFDISQFSEYSKMNSTFESMQNLRRCILFKIKEDKSMNITKQWDEKIYQTLKTSFTKKQWKITFFNIASS